MRCPRCGQLESKVIDSRTLRDGEAIRRRRECDSCELRFTTYERLEESLVVTKKDGGREPFDRDKIRGGIELACKKREVSAEAVDQVVEDVVQHVYSHGAKEIPSDAIGKAVSEGLRGLEEVAFVRFMSVYRRFEDTGQFQHAIDQLERDKGEGGGGAGE